MKAAAAQAAEASWLHALAGALMIGGPVWHYLYVSRYPFDRPEAILLPLGAGLIGAAVALGAHRVGGVIGALISGLLLFGFLDLQVDPEKWLPTVLVVAGCFALPLILRTHRAALTCITLGAFDLASLPRPGPAPLPQSAPAVANALRPAPILLHLVLDEQWGVGGLRAAGDSVAAAFLRDFYLQRGFEVYEAAYSRWTMTLQSIPGLLSLGQAVELQPLEGGRRYHLVSNPYFGRLRELGYVIRVYQSSFLDYCRSTSTPVASCEEAPAVSIANVGYLRATWLTRATLAGRYFLNMNSHVYVRLHPDKPVWRFSFAGRGLAELEDARRAIAAGPQPGTAFFIHLMLPHRPLEVGADCAGYRDLAQRVGFGDPAATDSAKRARLPLYVGQVRCVHHAVAELLAALDRVVGRDGAIVIVQGDHGSRWLKGPGDDPRLSAMAGPQLNSAFSTLLAVRRPGVPAALHTEAVPVQDFLWALVGLDFAGRVNQQWAQYVRRRHSDSVRSDTLRRLSARDIPWLRQSP